jgi:glycerol transport system ATP-binding protein
MLDLEGIKVPVSEKTVQTLSAAKGQIKVGIRPEHIDVLLERRDNNPSFGVKIIEDTGAYKILTLESRGKRIKIRAGNHLLISEGDEVFVHFPEQAMKFYRDGKLIES